MGENLFKKIFISILVFFFIFFIIGLTKKQFVLDRKKIKTDKTTIPEFKNQENFLNIKTITKYPDTYDLFPPLLKETEKIRKEIETEFNKLTKNFHYDPNKSINQYQKELEKVIKNANIRFNDNSVDYQKLIALAQDLSKIKPPPIFSSFHREFIKIYLKAGITLKFAQQIKDPIEQIFLYNMVKNMLNELSEVKI